METKFYKYEKPSYVEFNARILLGPVIHEAVDDSLDGKTIIVLNDNKDFFKEFQSIKVIIDSYTKCYIACDIQSDERHTKTNKWKHTATLFEPTKYLEKVVCQNTSYTLKSNLLVQQINKVLINAEPILGTESPRFKVSTALSNFLVGVKGEDFFFDKPTLRETLDAMLSVKNARVEVFEITDFNNIVLDYYDYSAKNKLINLNVEKILNRQTVRNIEFLGSDIEAYGENAFSENRTPIWHPSPNGWDMPKTTEAILNNNNATFMTDFPVEQIDSFILKDFPYRATWRIPDPEGGQGAFFPKEEQTTIDIDIASNVVDLDRYNLLDEKAQVSAVNTTTLVKENAIYYTRGSNEIRNNYHQGMFFSFSAINNAGLNAIYKYLEKHLPEEAFNLQVEFGAEQSYPIINAQFRIQYVPYIDAHARISKVNYSEVPSTIISNQNDKTINLGRYGKNLFGTIQRLGNKELSIDMKHNSISEAFDLQDYTIDNYIVTSRDLAIYNNFIKAHYKLTKDFNKLSEKIGIDRSKRVYNIPLENFARDILIKEYIVASFDGLIEVNPLIRTFMQTFNNITMFPITNSLVRTEIWDEDFKSYKFTDYYELPVASYSMATAMLFKFKFMDNYSAGMSRSNNIIGGVLQKPNPYVGADGRYDKIEIKLFNDIAVYQFTPEQLPKANIANYNNYYMLFDRQFRISKDAYEHHQFTIQFEVISKDPDIIIGFSLAKLNALINKEPISFKLFYSLTEKYNSLDLQAKGDLVSEPTIQILDDCKLSVGGIEILGTNHPNVQSWCIADSDNNIVIAVNKTEDESIHTIVTFNHRRTRN